MSGRDGNESMEHDFGWSHAAFEAALRGSPDAPADLSALVAATVIDLTDPINDELAKHHIATSAAVARSVAHAAAQAAQIELAARTARAAHEELKVAPSRRRVRLRRRLTFAGAFSGMWAKIALGTAALAAVGTGAAVTDSLPDPMQAIVSDVAGVVGVELPHPDSPKVVGPSNPDALPAGGGASDVARRRGQDVQDYQACRKLAESAGLIPDEECTKPVPPGQDDDFVPPGQEKDKDTPPGQDDDFVPPGQEKDKDTPPGQDDDFVPPGQEKDKDTPPGQDDDNVSPGQDDDRDPPGQGRGEEPPGQGNKP